MGARFLLTPRGRVGKRAVRGVSIDDPLEVGMSYVPCSQVGPCRRVLIFAKR